jgi:hypothetical protein
MSFFKKIAYQPFFIKLFNWEYWSFNTVYALILPVWALLALRARSFFFFSAANPTIENGGFLMESKKKIYDIMPAYLYPKTMYFKAGVSVNTVLNSLAASTLTYPIIAKPDIGGRGRGVKKIMDTAALVQYITASPIDFLIQEFAQQQQEVGIFYYRYPDKNKGSVSGIVRKEMLTVTGDGRSTIRELLKINKRAILQLGVLEQLYGSLLNEILEDGVEKELVPYGNHARGAKFLDDSHLIDPVLINAMDEICKQVPGFFYGRMDIRYNTWEELRQGKNISIIEMNGAGSEPTHMYDPRHSIFFAWKEIIRHWIILWRISRINHKKGVPYLSKNQGIQLLKDNKAFEQKLNTMYV